MLHRSLFIVLLAWFSSPANCQVVDDFSDGDFTSNPSWGGMDTHFIVNASNELALNAPAATSESFLSLPSTIADSAVWQFTVRMDFNPSSSNKAYVYLIADDSDLRNPQRGYYVLIGNTADEVSLYRQDNSADSVIIDGTDGQLSTSSVLTSVKVTRSASGEWRLFADYTGGSNYSLEGDTVDTTYTTSGYFGILCDYTSTRSTKFFFDDFYVGHPISDTSKPSLVSIRALDSIRISLDFDEAVEQIATLSNYTLHPNGISPDSARYGTDSSIVVLTFDTAFTNAMNYSLDVINLHDRSGNMIDSARHGFFYLLPGIASWKDVVINEIMADPTPPAGLPEAEFVEIFNVSDKWLILTDWTISDPSTTGTLPAHTLAPGDYVVLCDAADSVDLAPFGTVVIPSNFPSLNNSGDLLTLSRASGIPVDEVDYRDSWYVESGKKDGGFSLERIRPDHPCDGQANWRGSDNIDGGTPGKANSVLSADPDTVGPEVLTWSFQTTSGLEFEFNESLDTSNQSIVSTVSGGLTLGAPVYTSPFEIFIPVIGTIDTGVVYQFGMQGVTDCFGNPTQPLAQDFGIGSRPGRFDLLIHELLPDPDDTRSDMPNVEFLELYNRSDQLISTEGLLLKDASSYAALNSRTIAPRQYLILCPASDVGEYISYGSVLGVPDWPSLNNAGDQMAILDSDSNVIHSVSYQDEWYGDDFKSEGGFSLEMIDPLNPCEGNGNWSASEDNLGGTPGAENSIAGINRDESPPEEVQALALDAHKVVVELSEIVVDPHLADYTITPGGKVEFKSYDQSTWLELHSEDSLEKNQSYMLRIEGLEDCASNISPKQTSVFGRVELAPDPEDIVINEILFNPSGSASDYVEIYNRSDSYFDLKGWALANFVDGPDSLDNAKTVASQHRLVVPQSIWVFARDFEEIINQYPSSAINEDNSWVVESMPSMPNAEGTVALISDSGVVLDYLAYSEDMHFGLLKDVDGVSLERIDYDRSSSIEDNWLSAAESFDFGTPGNINSQINTGGAIGSNIEVTPPIFSPDNDGFDDVARIQYSFDAGGNVATVSIHNQNGRLVRQLISNELLSPEGSFLWDGLDENGQRLPIGIYVVRVEVFNLEGETEIFRRAITLASRF